MHDLFLGMIYKKPHQLGMKVGKNNIKIMKKIRCYVFCRKPLLLFDAANIGFIFIHSEKK